MNKTSSSCVPDSVTSPLSITIILTASRTVDERLDTESVQIPPMLTQPFIENSIEHGIKHRNSKGNIKVRFLKKESSLAMEVEDDGVGREKALEILRGKIKIINRCPQALPVKGSMFLIKR